MKRVSRAQMRAHSAVAYAVRTGRITKPEACADCGSRGPVEGHHPDYDRPLDVIWLCQTCHQRTHGRRLTAASFGALWAGDFEPGWRSAGLDKPARVFPVGGRESEPLTGPGGYPSDPLESQGSSEATR